MSEQLWRGQFDLQFVQPGVMAELLMPDGRYVMATWRSNGRCTAWWTPKGKTLGLYNPVAFRVIEGTLREYDAALGSDDGPTQG